MTQLALLLMATFATAQTKKALKFSDNQLVGMSTAVLQDKIKGGWAGQTIGVTYGGPYEFKFLGTMMADYQPIAWPEHNFKQWYDNSPGLYDDIYMDLSFVSVIEKYGMEAPVDSFANAFAYAKYPLWHANQTGRYNILHGVKAPESGHWRNTPHADCIDFQIEADFAGLMSPGMPRAAAAVCDKVGHIMNYGDGWYGGVYMASMYSHAFISDDIGFVVSAALKSIPTQSKFYQCIRDVIQWHKKYPNDWKSTWFEVQKKWAEDTGCPDGVFVPFNIDARVNAAYVVIGLLYGKGDFGKTMDIATRCGQDADCNPSSAAGVLGTMIGYRNIPEFWKKDLREVEDRNFVFTDISLNKMYELGYKHALQMIAKNGGTVKGDAISIRYQAPVAVRFEQSFPGLVPVERKWLGWSGFALKDTYFYDFEGNGIVLTGNCTNEWDVKSDYVFKLEVDLDGVKEIVALPYHFTNRKAEIFWKYGLPLGKHKISLKLLNPSPKTDIVLKDVLVYSDRAKH